MSDPGLREKIYLGGITLAREPKSVALRFDWAETRQRYRDGTLATHRLAAPYTGAGERLSKVTATLTFEDLSGADVDSLNDLISYGGPLYFCPWLAISESFAVTSGAATSGTLARPDALRIVTPLPTLAATRYATSATRNGSAYTTIVLGTVASYRTPWTCSTASTGARVSIRYVPVYWMMVGEAQPAFSAPCSQGQSLILEEV